MARDFVEKFECHIDGLKCVDDFAVPMDSLVADFFKNCLDNAVLPDSYELRFLSGKMIELKSCCLSFSFNGNFLKSIGFEKGLNEGRKLNKLVRMLMEPPTGFIKGFLKDGSGAKIYVVPNTLKINLYGNCCLVVSFSALARLYEPIEPKALEFFRDGVLCDFRNGEKDFFHIMLGVLKYRHQLYINKKQKFFMVAPESVAECEKLFFREMMLRKGSLIEFARLVPFVWDASPIILENIMNLIRLRASSYSYLDCCKWMEVRRVDDYLFKCMIPSTRTELKRLCRLGSLNEEMLSLLDGFFRALNIFYKNVASEWGEPLWNGILCRIWRKILLDPVAYVDNEIPLVSYVGRKLLL